MIKKINQELTAYRENTVEDVEEHSFSTYKITRRIMIFKNQIYPTGKYDSQDNYKYWYDIISPRVNDEIKNYGRKIFSVASDVLGDAWRVLISNLVLREYLDRNGESVKLDDIVEQFVEWGNVVSKKVKGGYQRMHLDNFYVLNQTAETLEDSDVIEHE